MKAKTIKAAARLLRDGRRLINDLGAAAAVGTAFIGEVRDAADAVEQALPGIVARVRSAAKPPAKRVDVRVEPGPPKRGG